MIDIDYFLLCLLTICSLFVGLKPGKTKNGCLEDRVQAYRRRRQKQKNRRTAETKTFN